MKAICVLLVMAGLLGAGSFPAAGADKDDLLARGIAAEQSGRKAEALRLFEEAAQSGSSEAAFRAGTLNGRLAKELKGKARVLKENAGLRQLYRAATNQHAGACLNLAQAFRGGLGVEAAPQHAYAWLLMARKLDPSVSTDLLDELVVQLDTPAVQRAQQTVRRWAAGNWSEPLIPEIIEGDARMKINGITISANRSVLINRKTFMAGDAFSIAALAEKGGKAAATNATLEVACLDIGLDYALVKVAGEAPVRLLEFSAD